MKPTIYITGPVHIHCPAEPSDCGALEIIAANIQTLNLNQEIIMSQMPQAVEAINAATAAVARIGDETRTLLTKISELQAAVEQLGQTTPEFDAALSALADQVKVVDDLVPDAAV